MGSGTTINNCYSLGDIDIESTVGATCTMAAGGIAGSVYGAKITNCWNSSNISMSGAWNETAVVGGLAGWTSYESDDYIQNSYNTGNISVNMTGCKNTWYGGLVGISQTDLKNCWTSGSISGVSDNPKMGVAIGAYYSGTTDVYYLENACQTGGKGSAVTKNELENGALTGKLNQYVKSNFNKGLLTWIQTSDGPSFSSGDTANTDNPSYLIGTQIPSSWAVDAANWIKGYEIYDWFDGYWQYEICRDEFAAVAVTLVEEALGKTLPSSPVSTFTDTSDDYVLKAYQAGIVSGISAKTFDPMGSLTCEQLATMLYRTIRYIEKESGKVILKKTGVLDKFADKGQVSSWAADAVAALAANDIMKGTGEDTLSPKSTATIEQSLVLALCVLTGIK